MSFRKLLPYLVVMLIVAGGFFVSEYYQARQAAQEKAAKKIFSVKEGDITAFTLTRGQQEIRLKKEKDWQLVYPLTAAADTFTVHSLLGTLAELEKQRELAVKPEKLADYGLDQPKLILNFTAGDQTHQLRIGDKAPGGRVYYAQKGQDSKVLLINTVDEESLDRDLTALRDKTVFTFSPDQATALHLQTAKLDLKLKKNAPDTWTIEGQPQTRVRGDKIESLLRQLRFLRAREFVAENPENLKKYGLAPKPTARVSVSQGKQQETLLLGATQGEKCYAHKRGNFPIIQVDKDILERLPTSVTSLEDRRLWAGKEGEVHTIIWGPPDHPVTATKAGDHWRLTGPQGRSQQQTAINMGGVLWRLKDLEYDRLASPDQPLPAKPEFRFQLKGEKGKLLLTLEEFPAKTADLVRVRAVQNQQTLDVLMAKKAFAAWRQELAKLFAAESPAPE